METKESNKPSAGKTLLVAIVCWFVLGATCAITTWIGGSLVFGTYIGMSTGGLIGLVLAICLALFYRSRGELGSVLITALAVGIVLGIIVLGFSSYFLSGAH